MIFSEGVHYHLKVGVCKIIIIIFKGFWKKSLMLTKAAFIWSNIQ